MNKPLSGSGFLTVCVFQYLECNTACLFCLVIGQQLSITAAQSVACKMQLKILLRLYENPELFKYKYQKILPIPLKMLVLVLAGMPVCALINFSVPLKHYTQNSVLPLETTVF